MLVDLVFKYRTLLGKCDLGCGLDWNEIEQMTSIEEAFAPTADDRRMNSGRRFRRETTKLSAVMRGDKDDGDDYKLGLQLVGMPVRLNRAAISEHAADIVDKIAA